MTAMTISRLATHDGVGVETIRYYQRRGLLREPPRAGGIRRYGDDDASRLRFIRSAQAAGFTLDEIAELLRLDATTDRARVRHMAMERIVMLDARIADLQAARASLARLAHDCAQSVTGPCPIILSFERQGDR